MLDSKLPREERYFHFGSGQMLSAVPFVIPLFLGHTQYLGRGREVGGLENENLQFISKFSIVIPKTWNIPLLSYTKSCQFPIL